MDENFNLFLESVDEQYRDFVNQLNELLTKHDYKCNIKSAKNGYIVSYVFKKSKKTIANFVFRKTGMKVRIYASHINEYQSFLDSIPANMKKDIIKSSNCKRLIDPTDCNSRCSMGYIFDMDGEQYKKCRYMAFMPSLSEENNPFILQFIDNEISCTNS